MSGRITLYQGRKCNTVVENVVKVENATSKQKMLHRGGKCNFKILNVIKLENPTSMCIIQCKEKYIIVRTKYRGD